MCWDLWRGKIFWQQLVSLTKQMYRKYQKDYNQNLYSHFRADLQINKGSWYPLPWTIRTTHAKSIHISLWAYIPYFDMLERCFSVMLSTCHWWHNMHNIGPFTRKSRNEVKEVEFKQDIKKTLQPWDLRILKMMSRAREKCHKYPQT